MSEIKIKIEEATLADAPQLAARLYAEHQKLSEQDQDLIMAHIMKATRNSDYINLAATVEKRRKRKIVGFLIARVEVHPYGSAVIWIEHLKADERRDKDEVISVLIQSLVEEAKKLNIREIYIEAVNTEPLKRFGFHYDRSILAFEPDSRKVK